MTGMAYERQFGILDAERELIAAILADNRAYKAVRHLLSAAHFLSAAHQRQYAAIAAAIERGERVEQPMSLHRAVPSIDPLDHALMIYGSFLGREAIAPAAHSLVASVVALDGLGSN